MEDKIKATLNDFEIQSYFRELKKDLDLINITPYSNDYNEVYYSFFFQREGFIFAQKILFSSVINNSKKPDVKLFFEKAKESIERVCVLIDKEALNNNPCSYVDCKPDARFLVGHIEVLMSNIFSQKEFYDLRNEIFDPMMSEAEKLLSFGAKRRDVFSLLFRKYVMSFEELQDKVLNLKQIGKEI